MLGDVKKLCVFKTLLTMPSNVLSLHFPAHNLNFHWKWRDKKSKFLKFIYSEKATKFCEIFTLLLSYVLPVKSKVKILQNFVAFSEYMNFNKAFLFLILTTAWNFFLGLQLFSFSRWKADIFSICLKLTQSDNRLKK